MGWRQRKQNLYTSPTQVLGHNQGRRGGGDKNSNSAPRRADNQHCRALLIIKTVLNRPLFEGRQVCLIPVAGPLTGVGNSKIVLSHASQSCPDSEPESLHDFTAAGFSTTASISTRNCALHGRPLRCNKTLGLAAHTSWRRTTSPGLG